MRVVFLVLDAQPVRHVSSDTTPVLAGLALEGGWAPAGGRAVLTSATYPNHATFVTGVDAVGHGLYANHVVRDGRIVRAYDVGPSVPTVFDACRAEGRRAVAVFGDHHLVPVMGAVVADAHWPDGGRMPEGLNVDDYGYLHDSETISTLCAAAADAFDLLVAQLNGPDTAAHLHGPDSAEALAVYAETDGHLDQLVETLRPEWDDTVLMVVSDHDQTSVAQAEPVDLRAAAMQAGVDATIVLEGDGAVVVGTAAADGSWLTAVQGVAATSMLGRGLRFVSADDGRWFAPAGTPGVLKGVHGGLSTRAQVAVVAGGHPSVARIGASLAARAPDAIDWAVTIADLLDVHLPDASGRSLLT